MEFNIEGFNPDKSLILNDFVSPLGGIFVSNEYSGLNMVGNAYFFNASSGNVLLENVSMDKLKIGTPAVFENEGSFEIK